MYADEDLNALLDGELDSADAKAMRKALAASPVLAERLERIAMADSIVKSTYQEIDSAPLPNAVTNLLQTSESQGTNVSPIKRRVWTAWPMQVAASVVVCVGLFFGTSQLSLLKQAPTDLYALATTQGELDPSGALASILSENASAASYQLKDDNRSDAPSVAITPVLSFKSTIGDWCREFTVTTYVKSGRTLACKQREKWHIVLSSTEQNSSEPGEYSTASTVTSAKFDARVDNLIVGEPLSADQEAILIKSDWSNEQ